MNERIKELKLQAIKLVAESYSCDIEDFTDALDERVRAKVDEKFAELIVAECMSVAQEYDGAKLGGPGLIIAMRIEQRFGVEE